MKIKTEAVAADSRNAKFPKGVATSLKRRGRPSHDQRDKPLLVQMAALLHMHQNWTPHRAATEVAKTPAGKAVCSRRGSQPGSLVRWLLDQWNKSGTRLLQEVNGIEALGRAGSASNRHGSPAMHVRSCSAAQNLPSGFGHLLYRTELEAAAEPTGLGIDPATRRFLLGLGPSPDAMANFDARAMSRAAEPAWLR